MTQFDADTVASWLDRMQHDLQRLISVDAVNAHSAGAADAAAMIGIKTGGVDVGRHLHNALGLTDALGELNISFYRDDFSTIGLHPVVGPSQVPFSVDGRHIILVDDVLSTGRTVRAAMNEIFDYGRPARITLAVLVQRSGHELPIRADVIGHSLDVPATSHVNLDTASMSVTVGERSP
jgi:pyrimidine operon attenuation protein/uracil phosphoribosyltransferase